MSAGREVRVWLRLKWAAHLLNTADRLERKAKRLNYRVEDCRTFAARHLRRAGVRS